MIDLLLGPLAPILSALGAAVLAFFMGYRRANKARDAQDAKQRVEDMKTAQEVRDEIETLDDTGLADRAAKWLHGKH